MHINIFAATNIANYIEIALLVVIVYKHNHNISITSSKR